MDKFILPYPDSVGSLPIKPNEIDKIKEDSLLVMKHHADKQIANLKQQAELLIKQATDIDNRVHLAYKIAKAKYNFKPVFLKEYYLYKQDEQLILSMIGPHEWKSPYGPCIATVRQLGDSTWEQIN